MEIIGQKAKVLTVNPQEYRTPKTLVFRKKKDNIRFEFVDIVNL